MNNKNQSLNKIMLLVTSSILSGCFESPSSPSSNTTLHKQPLKETHASKFELPEGITAIRSAFNESKNPDWNSAQNWTTDFYKDSEIIAEDYAHRFVPCKTSTTSYILPNILIREGTCFVNENVEIAGLYMSNTTRMTIPEGVTVQNTGDVQTPGIEGIMIDGGGDLYISGESSNWRASARLNKVIAPKVRWDFESGSFEVNTAELGRLTAKKIYVKEQLSVGEIVLDDTKDLEINHLHITQWFLGKNSPNLYLGKTDRPLKIEKLSFEPGTLTKIRYGEWLQDVETADVEPVRLAGTLDVTNMNIFNTLPFRKSGTIGEKVPIIIADKGIIGDMSFLRKYRRRLVTGCWGTPEERIQDGFKPSDSPHLVWADGNVVYWQRMSSPLIIVEGGLPFIFEFDLEFFRAHKDSNIKYEQIINFSSEEWIRLKVICNAIAKQRKTMYEHATEAGIERFLAIQITRDAKDRARKMLDLVDVTPYLNESGELSQQGEQAVLDALSLFSLNPLNNTGVSIRKESYDLGASKQYGAAYHGTGYSLSGVFHQSEDAARKPWVLGFDYRALIQPNVWGVVRTLWGGSAIQTLALQAKSGISYAVTPTSQVTVLVGSRAVLGQNDPRLQNASMAYPMGSLWAMETSVEWSSRIEAHEVRLGGEVAYRPEQTVSVRVADLGVTFDHLTVKGGLKVSGSLSYAYYQNPGLRYTGTISLQSGDTTSVVGTLWLKLEY